METYCVRCKKKSENLNPKIFKNKKWWNDYAIKMCQMQI